LSTDATGVRWRVQVPTAQVPNPDPLDLTKVGTSGETINAAGVNTRSVFVPFVNNKILERRAAVFEPAGAFTVEAYVRRDNDDFPSVQLGTIVQSTRVNQAHLNNFGGWGLHLRGGSGNDPGLDGSLVLQMRNNADTGFVSYFVDDPALLITDDAWHFVAVTRDGAGNIRMFVDDAEDTTLGANGGNPYTGTLGSGTWFGIGQDLNAGVRYQYTGWIDEVRLSDAALEPSRFLDPVEQEPTQVIPEPATMALLGLGLIGVLRRRRR